MVIFLVLRFAVRQKIGNPFLVINQSVRYGGISILFLNFPFARKRTKAVCGSPGRGNHQRTCTNPVRIGSNFKGKNKTRSPDN